MTMTATSGMMVTGAVTKCLWIAVASKVTQS